jgi:deoxycytidylate deaminase
VVRSLRRPEEVEQLRRVYGPRFILIAVHTPEVIRQRNAEERWQRWAPTTGRYEAEATRDIRRDELDPEREYGQRTRETFSLADFFVNASSEDVLSRDIDRCVKLIFGWPFVPPTRDEQAMYHAYTAGLRSSEMGRQVGAAITARSGDLLALGTNDVPSGKGGLYWSPDRPDERDFAKQVPSDSNTLWKRRTARELLLRMVGEQWIDGALYLRVSREGDADELDVTEEQLDAFLARVKGTRFADISEFGRAVHAEMDAITAAARMGHKIAGATLVCTTFPCHNCTRHIVAAGLGRVVYIYPYAKSLARDLHSDAIDLDPEDPEAVGEKVVFQQFIGVAPRGYPQYFGFGQARRSNDRGDPVPEPDPSTAVPRVAQESGTFSFGGPAIPASRVAQLERRVVRELRECVRPISGVRIPNPADEEDEI